MTDYSFNEALFKKSFSVKEDKPDNTYRLNHTTDKCFKLFPYARGARPQRSTPRQ